MIAATIGRKFLLAYNRKFGTHYDAKTFFTEQYFPLFFDHEKYMQWVTNSPFVQLKPCRVSAEISKICGC